MKIIRNFLLLLSLFLMNLLVGNRLNAQNSTSKEDFHKHISYFFEFDDWASTNLPYISERFIGNVKQIYFDDYYLDIIGDTISEEQQKYYESIKEEFKASFLDTVYLRGKAFIKGWKKNIHNKYCDKSLSSIYYNVCFYGILILTLSLKRKVVTNTQITS